MVFVRLSGGLLLALVRDITRLLLHGRIRVLHESLVSLLRIRLGLDRIRLHGLRLRDDLLEHPHHPTGARGLLVRLEPRRRRRAGRLLLLRLHEGLVVEALEHVERVREEALRLAMIGNHILEVLVLELTVLAGTLELHLHLRDLGLQRRNRLREFIDRGREVRNLGLHLLDVALLHLLSHLVLVERIDAEVLHLDVVGLLLLQVGDHAVDLLRHLLEVVEADARGQRRQTRVAGLLRNGIQDLLRTVALRLGRLRNLDEVEGAREGVVGVVGAQDRKSLAHGLRLLRAGLRALLELLVRHLAGLLQVHQELLVRRQGVAGVFEVLLRLGELLIRIGELLSLRVLLVSARRDLRLLRGLEILVRGLALHLLLLRARQVRLEGLLHLLQNAKDGTGLRGVALLEGRLRIEVVARRLDERRDRLALGGRGDLVHQVLVLAELILDQHGCVDERLRRNLDEFLVVLAEDRDGALQRADGLKDVLLLCVELSEFLLAEGGSLVQSSLVLRDLGGQVLDLRVQASARGGGLLDGRRQVRDTSLSIVNRRRLVLVVRRAPAGDLLEDLLILLAFLLELRRHVLQKVDHLRDGAVLLNVLVRASGRCFGSKEKAREQQKRAHDVRGGTSANP